MVAATRNATREIQIKRVPIAKTRTRAARRPIPSASRTWLSSPSLVLGPQASAFCCKPVPAGLIRSHSATRMSFENRRTLRIPLWVRASQISNCSGGSVRLRLSNACVPSHRYSIRDARRSCEAPRGRKISLDASALIERGRLRCKQQRGTRVHKRGTSVRITRQSHELLGEFVSALPRVDLRERD